MKDTDKKKPTSRPPKSGKTSSFIRISSKPSKSKKKPNPPVFRPKPLKPPLTKTEKSIITSSEQPMVLVKPCLSCFPWSTPWGKASSSHKTKSCNFLTYLSRGKVIVNEIFKPQGVILLQNNVLQEQIQNILKEFIEFGEKTKSEKLQFKLGRLDG